MCYSEELKRDAGGYFVDGEWVLTGWKGMAVGKEVVCIDRVEDERTIHVMSAKTGFQWKPVIVPTTPRFVERTLTTYVSNWDEKYVYKFGAVLTDNHGFHLAASKKGAESAVPTGVYTRILAKESAIEKNHAHVVMLLEPGQDPTEDQIRAVALAKFDMSTIDWSQREDVYNTPGSVVYSTSTANYGWVKTTGHYNMGSAITFTQPNVASSWSAANVSKLAWTQSP